MKDFDALKDIWQSHAAAPKLDYDEILKAIKKSKNNFSSKLLIETFGALVAIALFLLIWINSPSMMWTTHLSLLIFLSCCFYYLFAQFKDYKSLLNSDFLVKEPKEYIEYLKNYRRKRYVLNTTKYLVYSLFIGLAFGLYFIEIYFSSPLWQTFLGISATFIWFLMCWFLMRIYIRKEQEKLSEMIEALEELEKQFNA